MLTPRATSSAQSGEVHIDRRRQFLQQPALVLLLIAVLQVGCSSAVTSLGLTVISDEWLERFCKQIARDRNQVYQIEKSSDGRELRVVLRDEVAVVTSTGPVAMYRKPGLVAWMNDQHRWIAWSDDLEQGFSVQTESTRTHVDGYPRFDADGRFFVVTHGVEARLYRVNPYRLEAILPLNSVSGVFSRPPLLFVAGEYRDTRRLRVYTYRDTGRGVDFVATRVIERPNGGHSSPFFISDVSGNGERFTIHEVLDSPLDFLSKVRVYDVASGQLRLVRTGYLPPATLFLAEDLRRRVSNGDPFTPLAATPSRAEQ
jgi:hypothetical protein